MNFKKYNFLVDYFCYILLSLLILGIVYITMHNHTFIMSDDSDLLMPHFYGNRFIPLRIEMFLARLPLLRYFDYNLLFLFGISEKNIEYSTFMYMSIKNVL